MLSKVVGYIRVSVQNDTSSIHSVETQLSMIQSYCERNDLELIDIFTDTNVSGGKRDRENLQKAVSLCKASDSALIVKDLSRLSRQAHECLKLMSEVDVIDVTLGMRADEKVLMMMALMADWERKVCSERQLQTYAYIRQAFPDRQLGYAPSLVQGRITARQNSTKATNEYAMKLAPLIMTDEPTREVAFKLMALGIKTRLGRDRWTAMAVSRMRKRIESLQSL